MGFSPAITMARPLHFGKEIQEGPLLGQAKIRFLGLTSEQLNTAIGRVSQEDQAVFSHAVFAGTTAQPTLIAVKYEDRKAIAAISKAAATGAPQITTPIGGSCVEVAVGEALQTLARAIKGFLPR